MAGGNKYKRCSEGSSDIYCRELGELSTEHMAYARNLWRDHDAASRELTSSDATAIETAPGYRKLFSACGKRIYGLHPFTDGEGRRYLAVHAGGDIYRVALDAAEEPDGDISRFCVGTGMAERSSRAFELGGELYILDGKGYYVLGSEGGIRSVKDEAYIPVTYLNGRPLEARNMLTGCFINRYTEGGSIGSGGSGYGWRYIKRRSADGSFYASVAAPDCEPEKMRCAYIPPLARPSGESETLPVRGYEKGAFDTLTGTVQLVCGAPISFGEYSLGGMSSLERLVLRSPEAGLAFNACDVGDGESAASPGAPLKELWTNAVLCYSGALHAYSHSEYGICSSSGHVTVYAAQASDMWCGTAGVWSPTRTDTVYGVGFSEVLAGESVMISGASEVTVLEGEAVGCATSVEQVSGGCMVRFSADRAYSHCVLSVRLASGGEEVRCILLRDAESGATNDERKKSCVYSVCEPIGGSSDILSVKVGGKEREYEYDAESRAVTVTLVSSDIGKAVDICGRGELDALVKHGELADIYACGAPCELGTDEMIEHCTVCCRFDGKVFFTGASELPNTVFYTSTDINGRERATYIGVYNCFNDGSGSECNVAMLGISGKLAVFKGRSCGDATIYYHTAARSSLGELTSLRPRCYTARESARGVPCVGAVGHLGGVPVFLAEDGIRCIVGSAGYIENRIQLRSRSLGEELSGLGGDAVMAEWKGYLCVLGGQGDLFLADSRELGKDGGTGEKQYEWFRWDGIGSWVGDTAVTEYSESRYIDAVDAESGEEATIELFGGVSIEIPAGTFPELAELSYSRLPVCRGSGEVSADSVVYSFSEIYSAGSRYVLTDGNGLECVLVRGEGGGYCLCPVRRSEERTGGEFSPACALAEHDGRLYFGSGCGDVCVFNTDKRGVAVNGAQVGAHELHSRWYDRCGHAYTSGFSTLFDDCGLPSFKKSTVPKTLVIKAKVMHGGAFSLAVGSEREDGRYLRRFTLSNGSFGDVDMGSFSFEGGETRSVVADERLGGWCEKQLQLYSDGFRQPFGVCGISYCYRVQGKVR